MGDGGVSFGLGHRLSEQQPMSFNIDNNKNLKSFNQTRNVSDNLYENPIKE